MQLETTEHTEPLPRDPRANGVNSGKDQRDSTKSRIQRARNRPETQICAPILRQIGNQRKTGGEIPPSSALPLGTKIATRSGGCKREGDFGRRTNLPGDLGRARSRCSPTLSSSASGGAKKKDEWPMRGRLRASRGGREAGWVGRGLDPVYVGLRGCWRAGSLRCTCDGSRRGWACAPRLKLQRATDPSRALFRK